MAGRAQTRDPCCGGSGTLIDDPKSIVFPVKKKKPNRQEIIDQWLDLYPIRQYQYETSQDGKITVMVPHSENWLTKKILPAPKKPAQQIRLDELGSFVWNHCDGKNSVREICNILEEKFKDRADSAQERTVLFVQQMYQQNFIKVYSHTSPNNTRQ